MYSAIYDPYNPYINPVVSPFRGFGGPGALPFTYSTRTYNPLINYASLGFQPLLTNQYATLLPAAALQPTPVLGTSVLPLNGTVLGRSTIFNSLI